MNNRKTIAIIGASLGQKCLYEKSREMGLYIIGFAWDKGVLTEDLYDEFHEISVKDTKQIAEICQNRHVDGVVTNASEFLIPLASEVGERLGLIYTPARVIRSIQDKEKVREITSHIQGLSVPKYQIYNEVDREELPFPCVVKPVRGAAKKGVSFCRNLGDLSKAVSYAGKDERILVEEYIPGREISIESLSYRGNHTIVQVTDKDSSGPPHFVELGHHQPSSIDEAQKQRVRDCVVRILKSVGFQNGATHIEMKLDGSTGKLYLIEINCRGGGDHISDTLVNLSTDCDFIEELINISLDNYQPREYRTTGYSGICYLSLQNKSILKYFTDPVPDWIIYTERRNSALSESTSNYDRDGYFIYKSSIKPIL